MLDARQLEALVAVLEHGSFGAAAEQLHLTLAAVSLRVKALEESLGQRLLVRGKRLRATVAGQALLAHARQLQLMEADLLASLPGHLPAAGQDWHRLSVAVNADSVAAWFLPGVAPLLRRQRLLLDIVVDDQDHTHDALKHGEVNGCVTTLASPMHGCVAEPLGVMRYRCVALPELVQQCRIAGAAVSPHRLLALPAVIFNRKDALQDIFLERHFGLRQAAYPRHFVPATDAFMAALELGLGWGMVPEHELARRVGGPELIDLLPQATVDVALYWQHWLREPPSAQALTQAVRQAASQQLAPLPPAAGGD